MEWKSVKRQRWDTKIQKSGSGIRKSLSRWAYPEWDIECGYTCLSDSDIDKAAGFFGLVRGQYQPFLWRDSEDYQQTKVRVGVGDGVKQGFQLLKNLANLYIEHVKDIVPGTLKIYVDDVEVDATLGVDGMAIAAIPPGIGVIVTASFQYYWRVAFADDDLEWSNFWYNFYKLNKIKLVTVK